ncbi:MAG: septum formation initiator family protein [Rhodothermales bacterium]|nr:septum formation initiator family protein [Rhodothermales bacterium]
MPSRHKKRQKDIPGRSLKKPLGVIVGASLLIWLLFFDSHSLVSRIQWYQEYKSLEVQNAHLQYEIDLLEAELARGLSDEAVERIAREEFGMRRDNETVYPVINDDD